MLNIIGLTPVILARMRPERYFMLLLLFSVPAPAQSRKSIFVITDAEGVAGICRQDQTDPKDPELRQLLTGEVNAAVEGFLAGGADEVVVWDGHDGSQTLSALTIHPKARLMVGFLGATLTMERKYAGVAFVGQHSLAGTRAGIMAHSYDSLGIQNIRMNGKPVGETATRAAVAGWYDIPVILLTGDEAAARELLEIVPDAEVAVVKEGLARYTCLSMSATAARDLIRERAQRAMQKIGTIKPYKMAGPVTIEYEYTTRNTLPIDAHLRPGAEVLNDRTIRYSGKDFMEAWLRSQVR